MSDELIFENTCGHDSQAQQLPRHQRQHESLLLFQPSSPNDSQIFSMKGLFKCIDSTGRHMTHDHRNERYRCSHFPFGRATQACPQSHALQRDISVRYDAQRNRWHLRHGSAAVWRSDVLSRVTSAFGASSVPYQPF